MGMREMTIDLFPNTGNFSFLTLIVLFSSHMTTLILKEQGLGFFVLKQQITIIYFVEIESQLIIKVI